MTAITVILLSTLVATLGIMLGGGIALSLFALPYFAALQPSYPELASIKVPMWQLISHLWRSYSALRKGNWRRYLELERSLVREFGERCITVNKPEHRAIGKEWEDRWP